MLLAEEKEIGMEYEKLSNEELQKLLMERYPKLPDSMLQVTDDNRIMVIAFLKVMNK